MPRRSARPERWLGQTVVDAEGHPFATVTDVLLDSRTAVAAWVVVRPRGLWRQHHAVPASLVHEQDGHVALPVSRFVARRSPTVTSGEPVTAAGELSLRGYWRGHH